MAGIGQMLSNMYRQVAGYGSGAPRQPSAAGALAGQLADAAGQQAGMPVQTPGSQFDARLQQALTSPMFNIGAGLLMGSQPGGGGALQGALGGAMNWQQMQLAAQKNAMALQEADARLEGLKLKNSEARMLAQGREKFASLQRQNPDASPGDLLRLWAATSGDPKAVQAWAEVADRDDQRQKLADYRQQLLDENQRYHDLQIGQGERRIGIQQQTADQGQQPKGPGQRAIGSTRDRPLGGEMFQREERTDKGWQPYGQPFRRSSNPLADLLGGDGGAPQAQQPVKISTRAEFDALPAGALFIDPDDGKTYRK